MSLLPNHHAIKPEALTDKQTPEIMQAQQQSRLRVRAQYPGGACRLETLQIAPLDSWSGEPDNMKLPALVTGLSFACTMPLPPTQPPPYQLHLHFCPLSLPLSLWSPPSSFQIKRGPRSLPTQTDSSSQRAPQAFLEGLVCFHPSVSMQPLGKRNVTCSIKTK